MVSLGKSRSDKAFGPIRTLGRIEAVKKRREHSDPGEAGTHRCTTNKAPFGRLFLRGCCVEMCWWPREMPTAQLRPRHRFFQTALSRQSSVNQFCPQSQVQLS